MAKMKKKPQQTESPAEEQSFEQAQAELEAIAVELEDGRIGLAEAMARYEQGVKLLGRCHAMLEHAERKIELLSGVDRDGNPITQPFDDTSSEDLDKKTAGGPRRRSVKRKTSRPEPSLPAESEAGEADIDAPGHLF